MHPTLPTRTRHPCLRQAAIVAGLALLLSACGGGNGSATDLGKAAGSTTSAAAPSFSESIALQAKGAALNAQELDEARAEAERLPGNTPLVAGQTAPRAAYKSGLIAKGSASVQLPVYRFYNTQTGSHFYTRSTAERESVQATLPYMSYEGQAFVAAAQPSNGLRPVYRFFNTQTGVHFYTISENERGAIEANLPQFKLEGIAYYASQVAGLGLTPLYRFFLGNAGTHFYTASATERQNVQDTQSATHTYEGVGYYVLNGDCTLVNVTRAYAEPNDCLMANNAAQVAITLPLSAYLAVGDTLKVSGLGAGDWRISQNAQQYVQTTLPGAQRAVVWTLRESNRDWASVASSADGNKLVAVAPDGPISTSIDAGITWIPRSPPLRNWVSVTSSADGNKLVAVDSGERIYTSVDAGLTWTPRGPSRDWALVTSSDDGNKLVAVEFRGQIYTSMDAGLTWTPRESNRDWRSVASSADGNKLVAVVYGGQIHTSMDAGLTWAPRASNREWTSVASSADGNKLVAVVSGGQIYTSIDAGLNWTPRESVRSWSSVASSADGNKLVAVVYGGQIYTSMDAGLTWTPRESNRLWTSVASSADGNKLFALVFDGGFKRQIYTSQTSTNPGVAVYLQGAKDSAIEIKYLGNGRFEVISSSGTVSVEREPG